MTRHRVHELARRVLPKVASAALAIGSDTAGGVAGLALVVWHLHTRMRAIEDRLAELENGDDRD